MINPESLDNVLMEKILPTLLIIIDILAAFVYAFKSGYWHFVYWMAAAVLTYTVTYKL